MNSGCVQNQIKQSKREQQQSGQGAYCARARQARAKQNEMANVAEMSAIEPEVIAIFIKDENLGGKTGREHPLPFGHDRFGGADDTNDGIVIGVKLSVEPLAGVAVGIIGDAIDVTTRRLKILRYSAVAGEQIGLHRGMNIVESAEQVFQ